MPEGNDPDDFIKKNTKDGFIKLLENKIVIQQYLWTHYLNKIDKNNPFEISSFEKEIKKLCYSIKDETLKKYILEDFLEKIKKLTLIQSSRKNYSKFKKFNYKQDYQMLNETKSLHKKKTIFLKFKLKNFQFYL